MGNLLLGGFLHIWHTLGFSSSARAAELNGRVKQCFSESAASGENKVTNDNIHRQMVENPKCNIKYHQ